MGVSVGGCCDDTIDEVYLTLSPVGSTTTEYLWVGDTVTIAAQGVSLGAFCIVTIEDSHADPTVFLFESSDPLVATVDASGLLQAAEPGTTLLTAAIGDMVGEQSVYVSPRVESIRLIASVVSLAVGDTLRLTVRAFDPSGAEVEGAAIEFSAADGPSLTWDPPYVRHETTPSVRSVVASEPGQVVFRVRTRSGFVRQSFLSDSATVHIEPS